MSTVTCPKCGAENPAEATICRKCRIDLKFALEHHETIEPLKENKPPTLNPLHPKYRWLAIVLSILLFIGSLVLLRGIGLWIEDSLSWQVIDELQEAFSYRPIGISILLIMLLLLLITGCLQGGVWLAERLQRYGARKI